MKKKRQRVLLIMVLFIFFIISIGIVHAVCPHGVRICGIYHDCGNATDGICPEDYGVNCCAADCPVYDSDCGGICPWCTVPEVCTDNIDNDCDGATDGCDSDCSEGQGMLGSSNRCCEDGTDNDGDGLIDNEDPGCCDFCLLNPSNGFDSFLGEPCGVGCDCGGIIFNWETLGVMTEYCCGDDTGENFISTTIGLNTYYACCDNSSDCVDANGECQPGTEEVFELCTNGVDDDCDGLIDGADTNCTSMLTGYVFDEQGLPLSGALVKGSPPGKAVQYESSATTIIDGSYSISNALVGNYSFVARKEGYDDQVTTISIVSGQTTQINFTLRNGSCHIDCTDYYGNCNPICKGVSFGGGETCNLISDLCYNRPQGFIVRSIDENNTMHEYTCCEGPERTYPVLKTTVRGEIENLYDYVINVKLGGRYVKMHILIWRPKK